MAGRQKMSYFSLMKYFGFMLLTRSVYIAIFNVEQRLRQLYELQKKCGVFSKSVEKCRAVWSCVEQCLRKLYELQKNCGISSKSVEQCGLAFRKLYKLQKKCGVLSKSLEQCGVMWSSVQGSYYFFLSLCSNSPNMKNYAKQIAKSHLNKTK